MKTQSILCTWGKQAISLPSNVNINCYNLHGERFENIYEKAYNFTSSFDPIITLPEESLEDSHNYT